jgi:hypothetical protein
MDEQALYKAIAPELEHTDEVHARDIIRIVRHRPPSLATATLHVNLATPNAPLTHEPAYRTASTPDEERVRASAPRHPFRAEAAGRPGRRA